MSSNAIDPSLEQQPDIRPSVGRDKGNASLWLFGAAAILAAILLFTALDSRRRELAAPAVRARASDLAQLPVSPPPLYIPPEPLIAPMTDRALPADTQANTEAADSAPPPMYLQPEPALPSPPAALMPVQVPEPTIAPSAGPVLVLDTSGTDTLDAAAAPGNPGATAPPPATAVRSRVRATQSRQRETTISQGTLIPAVLETALDSTRPGQARALVSQDVRGYAGKYVLIPRGSRLFGEYRAELAPGQNRALVQWTRLDRPDGVTIALDSPAADALGRAGIRGRVNSHFFERFGAAILQSALDLGVSVAARSVGDSPVIVALPTGALGSQAITPPTQIQPTLKVRQGSRISVFVARDLDFTAVERRR